MSKPKVLFLLGIGVLLIPFLGVPYTFKMVIAVLFGISVCTVSMFLHIEKTNEKKAIRRPRVKKSRALPMTSASMLEEHVMAEASHYQAEALEAQAVTEE